ncbi:MAG: hypothetical protein V4538_10855 [Bacteroidota bacterium]
MKKINLLFALLLTVTLTVNAQWVTNGSDEILNNGNVGIGTPTPENVEGWNTVLNVNGEEHSKIIATTNNANVYAGLWAHAYGFYGSPTGGITGTRSDHAFSIITNAANRLTVSSGGNIGIGTSSPIEKLDIMGGIRFGNTTLNNPGTIRYTGTDFEGYVGGQWKSLINNTGPVQWAGPTGGILSTGSTVSITKSLVVGLPGTVFPPLFEVNSNNGTTTTSVFKVDHNRIDVNANLLINSSSLSITRGGSVPGTALFASSAGVLTLNTNGVSSPIIGFFINSNNRNFFTVTEQQILYKNATQDLFKVDDNGYVYARKSIVTLANPFPDYVFENNYKLKPLSELGAYISKYKHLPNIPSAEEIAANKNQIDVGEMQVKLLEKVEELHLYVLQQQKEIEKQQKEIETLKAKLAE